ncbi:hypothetical protein GPALN_005559 [Globodera pallida]|nr:hypothetical protein GPALN_005559 [Globodera pallida]
MPMPFPPIYQRKTGWCREVEQCEKEPLANVFLLLYPPPPNLRPRECRRLPHRLKSIKNACKGSLSLSLHGFMSASLSSHSLTISPLINLKRAILLSIFFLEFVAFRSNCLLSNGGRGRDYRLPPPRQSLVFCFG